MSSEKTGKSERKLNNKQTVLSNVSATDFLTSMTLLAGYKCHINEGAAVSCKKKDVLNLTLTEYKIMRIN